MEFDIKQWEINQLLYEEGFRARSISVCENESDYNTDEIQILNMHIGFRLAEKEVNKRLSKQSNVRENERK